MLLVIVLHLSETCSSISAVFWLRICRPGGGRIRTTRLCVRVSFIYSCRRSKNKDGKRILSQTWRHCLFSSCHSNIKGEEVVLGSPLRCCYCLPTCLKSYKKNSCGQDFMEENQYRGGERKMQHCRRGPQIWPWLVDEQKNLFPSLQTVVNVFVIEGLGIDLNYLGCLQKWSEVEAESCNEQRNS